LRIGIFKKHSVLFFIWAYSIQQIALEKLTVTQQVKTFLDLYGPSRVVLKSTAFWDVAPCDLAELQKGIWENMYTIPIFVGKE
jgi:hypothetical protein